MVDVTSSAMTTNQAEIMADLRALHRGTTAGPGFVQALEAEQAFGEALFEGGGGRQGALSRPAPWPP